MGGAAGGLFAKYMINPSTTDTNVIAISSVRSRNRRIGNQESVANRPVTITRNHEGRAMSRPNPPRKNSNRLKTFGGELVSIG